MKIQTISLIVLFLLCAPSERSAFGQASGGAANSDDAQLERLFLDAELLLDSERKPKEAAKLFRKVWKDRAAPRILKAEALAGLIRCERLLGNDRKVNSLLRDLVDDFGDLPSVSLEILRLSTGAPGTSFLSGIEIVDEGRFLDLDTGGVITTVRSGSGSAPELMVRNKEVVFLTTSREDKAMSRLAQKIYDAPWHRVNTDLGRNAWVQIIGTREPIAVFFYTALAGTQNLLPAPRNLFCVGKSKQIDVHFEASDLFSAYRVERQDAVNQPFQVLKTVRKGPFTDRDVVPGSRYLYKIVGIGAHKAESLPATVDGTTNSNGVVSGSATLVGGRPGALSSFDFLTGKRLEGGGDITMTGMYGSLSAASFADCFGVHAHPLPGELRYSGRKQIPPYTPFHIFLRGGGVARCLWKPVENWVVLVEYTVNPDGANLDNRPIVTVHPYDELTVVNVAAPEGYKADSVVVTDAEGDEKRILKVKNGQARDRKIKGKRFLTYSATCVDPFGRRTAPGSASVTLTPGGMSKGEFQFQYDRSYSIEQGKIVPFDEGDISFVDCSGGLIAVEFQAEGGIANLEWGRSTDSVIDGCAADGLFQSVVSADPSEIVLGRRAEGDSRNPCEDVFILKTRHGGWAKLVIAVRSHQDPWKDSSVTIGYVYNPHEPVFREEAVKETIVEQGVTFDATMLSKSREALSRRQRQVLADLDRRAADVAESYAEKSGDGVRFDAILGRHHASLLNLPDDYQVATFNFEHATRDDTELVRNDWDIEYGNGSSKIRAFDMGSIWDLGAVDFDSVAIADGHSYEPADDCKAEKDHVYVIHSLDRSSDFWIKMQIVEMEKNEWIIFRWKIIDDVEKVIRLERLPDLDMAAPVVTLQLRAGAGGGNPNRVTMNGSTSAYVDVISDRPLDLTTAPNIAESSWCYFEGGFIPEGKVWIVKFIQFMARTDGDTNGRGEFLLQLGPYTVAHLPKNYDSKKVIYTIDGGVRPLKAGEFVVRHSVALNVPLQPGDEKNVFAEVANSSLCNVVIRGDFVDAKNYHGRHDRGVPALEDLSRQFLSISRYEKADAGAHLETYARSNGDLLPYLEKILGIATDDDYAALLERMIQAAEQ